MKKHIHIFIIIFITISYKCFAADTIPAHIPYQWISYQAKLDVKSEKTAYHCQLFFVNRIDSVIYLHLSFSGIEIARMVLSPEKVVFVNKFDASYYQGDYTLLRKFLEMDVDFYMLQAVFNGVDFPDFEGFPNKTTEEGLTRFIFGTRSPKSRATLFAQEINLNNAHHIVSNIFEDLGTKNQIIVKYDNYSTTDKSLFFNNLTIQQEEKELLLKADLKKIKFNTPGPTSISIPDGFKEMTVDEE